MGKDDKKTEAYIATQHLIEDIEKGGMAFVSTLVAAEIISPRQTGVLEPLFKRKRRLQQAKRVAQPLAVQKR